MRLIDADKLIKKNIEDMKINTDFMTVVILSTFNEMLVNEPEIKVPGEQQTVEAEPVRHGEWKDRYNNGDWHCTVCGAIVEKDEQSRHNWYRCYHCGAKMDGGCEDENHR